MAKMYPPVCPESSPKSEHKIHKILSALSDEWHIFHSVYWQSKRNGREGDGECDFIILNKNYGLIILEVKGGGIEIENGVWYSNGYSGKNIIKNPFEQAKDGKYSLLKFLNDLGLGSVPVNHAVSFPDQSEDMEISTYGPRDIIWYQNDLKQITDCIKKTNNHWKANCTLTTETIKKIKELIAPTFKIKKKLADHISDTNESIINLTEKQIWAFNQCSRNRRVIVQGNAGTGKTILALEKMRKLKQEGFSPIFLCYNELLAKDIKSKAPHLNAMTYHALCYSEIKNAGMPLPLQPNNEWWNDKAPNLLIDAASKNNTSFDSIIIDEAQDFSSDWISSLQILSRDALDPLMYIFSDYRQDLYKRSWNKEPDFFYLDLDVNCRNTVEIAKKVSNLFQEEPITLGISGPKPIYCELNVKSDAIDFIQSFVLRLIEEEFVEPNHITILSNDNKFVDRLRTTYAGSFPFTSWGKKGICCETIKRFKGLENEVVLLVLNEEFDITIEELYVGLSRPKVQLAVIGSPKFKKIINWL